MKKISLYIFIFLSMSLQLHAQSVGINNNTPDASAALDVTSTSQGILVPRMTATQRGLIASPATGLLVYQTDAPIGFYYYNGTAWASMSGSGGSGDNLGNHTATQNLDMGGNSVTNTNNLTATGTATLGGNAYPTNTGTNDQILTTDGAGTLSWSSKSSFKVVLHATQATAQTISTGVSVTNGSGSPYYDNVIVSPPPAIGSYAHYPTAGTGPVFINISGGGSTWPLHNAFTCNQSGTYLVTATILSTQTGTNSSALAPIIVVMSATDTKALYFGTAFTQVNALPPYNRGRGHISQVVPLDAGDKVSIFVNNLSTSSTAPISTEKGATSLTIVKMD